MEKTVNFEEPEKKLFKDLGFLEKIRFLRGHITVEPLLACLIFPSVLSRLAVQNLNLEKACRVNMNYSVEVCDALKRRDTANYTVEEKAVQQLVAGMQGWTVILHSFLPCMLLLFWGSWSDRHGRRKPCMLLPLIGEFCAALGLIVCVFFERVPMEVCGVVEALLPGIMGGWPTMLIGVFSYIADITTTEERTARIGILSLCVSALIPMGLAMSGILVRKIGFYGIFSIAASAYMFAFLYGSLYLKESPLAEKVDQSQFKSRSVLGDFFEKDHVAETFRVAFKKGENRRRAKVVLLMIVVMVVIGPRHGEMSVAYLFTRYKFNWSEVEYSVFTTTVMLTGLLGTTFAIGVFSHTLKMDDPLLGIISTLSKILSSFVFAFAPNVKIFYLGILVEIFQGAAFIAMRSIASKLVSSYELGKINSLFGVCEALMPLVYGPMYALVYRATLETMPGIFYLLGGGLTLPAVFVFLWMYIINRTERRAKAIQDAKEETEKEKEVNQKDSMELQKGLDNPVFQDEKEK